MLTLAHFLSLGAILFCLSVAGIFLNRKNVIILLMSIELMLLAVNMNFVAFSRFLGNLDGQVFVFFILTVPAAEAAIGLAMLVVLSILKPAQSMEAADLATTVAVVDLDWFYLNVYPLLDSVGAGPMWLLLGTVTGVLALLPWMPRRRRANATVAPAVVNPANCNGSLLFWACCSLR